MNRCKVYNKVIKISTSIRRFCGVRIFSGMHSGSCCTNKSTSVLWKSHIAVLRHQQYHQYQWYGNTRNDVMRQWSSFCNEIVMTTRSGIPSTRRPTIRLPHHAHHYHYHYHYHHQQQQQQQQQRRSMAEFEDHFDAMKQIHELPKMINDEDRIESYLTINFEDDAFIDTLHGIVCDFQQQFQKAICRPMPLVRHNHEWGQINPVDIQIYPKEKLRSILLFDYQDTLFHLSVTQICQYHKHLTRQLKKYGFQSNTSYPTVDPYGNINEETRSRPSIERRVDIEPQSTHHWYFRVKELKLAPRAQKNKIIVVFQPSPFWKHLHKQVQHLANRTNGLYRTMTNDECDHTWEPFIPIAHVYNGMGGSSKNERKLEELLRIMPFNQFDVSSKIQSISLTGTIPILPHAPTSATLQELFHQPPPPPPPSIQQELPHCQQLNWNFQFHTRPLLQIQERTNRQDSFPDDDDNNNDDYDDEFMPDPFESDGEDLVQNIHLKNQQSYRTADDAFHQYDLEGLKQFALDANTPSNNIMQYDDDEEIDTDDVIMNDMGNHEKLFKVPDDWNVFNSVKENGDMVDNNMNNDERSTDDANKYIGGSIEKKD